MIVAVTRFMVLIWNDNGTEDLLEVLRSMEKLPRKKTRSYAT